VTYFLEHGSREGSYCISLVEDSCLGEGGNQTTQKTHHKPPQSIYRASAAARIHLGAEESCSHVLRTPSSSVVYPEMYFPISFKRQAGGGPTPQNTLLTLRSLNETTSGNKLHRLHRAMQKELPATEARKSAT